jgi:hypothetical protein
MAPFLTAYAGGHRAARRPQKENCSAAAEWQLNADRAMAAHPAVVLVEPRRHGGAPHPPFDKLRTVLQ